MRTFISYNTKQEALDADKEAFKALVKEEGARGAQWSGVYTDGVKFGIVWDLAINGVIDMSKLTKVDEDPDKPWSPILPEEVTSKE